MDDHGHDDAGAAGHGVAARSARAALAAELRRIRRETTTDSGRRLGMRPFATKLGLGPKSQSSVADFEHGRRIPVDDIIARYQELQAAGPALPALAEAARREEQQDKTDPSRPEVAVPTGWWTGLRVAVAIATAVLAVGVLGWVFVVGRSSDSASAAGTDPSAGSPAASLAPSVTGDVNGVDEVNGADARTWTDWTNAGGQEGPTIPAGSTVLIACRTEGFAVQDGNTWWYRIAGPPWNGNFYVSADAFYNNGSTSGPLRGTPFVDDRVPTC